MTTYIIWLVKLCIELLLFDAARHIVKRITICILPLLKYNDLIQKMAVVFIFNYEPLWKTMEAKGVTQYQLLKAGIDNRTLDSLKKGKNITMITLSRLCRILDCTANDIVNIEK